MVNNFENNPLFVKVRVSKKLYKQWDSYQRYQKWIGKALLKEITATYKKA